MLWVGLCLCLLIGAGPTLGEAEPEGPEPLPEGGYDHPRGSGFVNVRIVDNRFEIHFLDENRIPQPVEYDRAMVFYEHVPIRSNRGSILVEATSDGMKLIAPRPVRAPPLYFARVVFLRDGESAEMIPRFDLR